MEDCFRKFWSLKEAYTKARGDGLGFEFKRCEFVLANATGVGVQGQSVQQATLKVDGRSMPHWGFYIQALEEDHWISVARGPPTDIVDANGTFKKTFGDLALKPMPIMEELKQPEPRFDAKQVSELVADEMRDTLLAATQLAKA